MADGSVIIGVSLDTTLFYRSIELVEERIASITESMISTFSSVFSEHDLFSSVDNALKQISGSASSTFGSIYTTVQYTADSSAAYFAAAPWKDAGTSAATDVSNGIKAGYSTIQAAINEIISKVTAAFSTANWSSIGVNISRGISQGMTSSAPEIANAASRVSKNTVDSIKGNYRISSPSALMRDEVGVMISRGIAEGITSGASFIGNALSSVYGETSSAYKNSYADIPHGGSMTQNIYLRDSDYSPYRTAKRIRRESEAIFGI